MEAPAAPINTVGVSVRQHNEAGRFNVKDMLLLDQEDKDEDYYGDAYSIRSMRSATPLAIPSTKDDDDYDDEFGDLYSIQSMNSATPMPPPLSQREALSLQEKEAATLLLLPSRPNEEKEEEEEEEEEDSVTPPTPLTCASTPPSAPPHQGRVAAAANVALARTRNILLLDEEEQEQEKSTTMVRHLSPSRVQRRDYAAGLTVGMVSCLLGGTPLWTGLVAGLGVTCAAATQVPGTVLGDASRTVGDVALSVQERICRVLVKSSTTNEEEQEYVLVPRYSPEWMAWQETCRQVEGGANRISRFLMQWAQRVAARRQEARRQRQRASTLQVEAEQIKQETVEARDYFTKDEKAMYHEGLHKHLYVARVT